LDFKTWLKGIMALRLYGFMALRYYGIKALQQKALRP